MKSSKLKAVFVAAPEDHVRRSLSEIDPQKVPPIVPADGPEARQQVADGALCLIPAEGGVVVAGDLPSSLEKAIEGLSPP
jgi:hypothetical protein